VLVKNAEALERLESVDTLVVDKTGTLTAGKPTLSSITSVGDGLITSVGDGLITSVGDGLEPVPSEEALRLAASLEQSSEHPLAAAIVRAAHQRSLILSKVLDFKAEPGKGIGGSIDGRRVVLGNAAMMADTHVDIAMAASRAATLRSEGHTVMYLAIDGHLTALLEIADPIKPTTAAAIQALRTDRLRILMLTGDNEVTARAVAKQLGVDEVRAGVLPADKRDVIRELQQQGRSVAMAGDGINDAPALAEAAVGVAMGTGADVAIESADITLVKGDLNAIVRARRLSRATMRNIRQNLFLAFVYNAVGVPVAAGVLYPFTGSFISPMWASAAMTLSSVSVILNALRLRRVKL
jgi:Cu+-exporting ATPase